MPHPLQPEPGHVWKLPSGLLHELCQLWQWPLVGRHFLIGCFFNFFIASSTASFPFAKFFSISAKTLFFLVNFRHLLPTLPLLYREPSSARFGFHLVGLGLFQFRYSFLHPIQLCLLTKRITRSFLLKKWKRLMICVRFSSYLPSTRLISLHVPFSPRQADGLGGPEAAMNRKGAGIAKY